MKKLLTVVAAGLLVFGVAGQAKASFSQGDLFRVVYNTTTNTEVMTDLGTAASILANPGSLSGNSINLSTYFGTGIDASTLLVAYFGLNSTATTLYTGDGGNSPLTAASLFVTGRNGIQNTENFYKGQAGTATTFKESLTAAGYYSDLDQSGGGAEGTLNSYLAQDTEMFLASSGSVTEELISMGGANDLFTLTSTVTGGALSTSGPLSATPIPPSVLLLGSGLLGLVGLKRKDIFSL